MKKRGSVLIWIILIAIMLVGLILLVLLLPKVTTTSTITKEYCEQLEGDYREICYPILVSETRDESYCKDIGVMDEDFCIAIANKDESFCERSIDQDEGWMTICKFFSIIYISRNEKYCEDNPFELEGKEKDEWKYSCYSYFGMSKRDLNLCEKLPQKDKYGGLKNACYSVIAVLTKDESICEKIDGSKNNCYFDVATSFRDPLLCEKIGKDSIGKQKGMCYYKIAIANNDASLCDKVKAREGDYSKLAKSPGDCRNKIARSLEYIEKGLDGIKDLEKEDIVTPPPPIEEEEIDGGELEINPETLVIEQDIGNLKYIYNSDDGTEAIIIKNKWTDNKVNKALAKKPIYSGVYKDKNNIDSPKIFAMVQEYTDPLTNEEMSIFLNTKSYHEDYREITINQYVIYELELREESIMYLWKSSNKIISIFPLEEGFRKDINNRLNLLLITKEYLKFYPTT